MIAFPQAVIGCPSRASYGYSASTTAVSRKPVLKGRPRHTLKDTHPVDTISLTFQLTAAQFNAWQTFWTAISNGVEWFTMDLQVDQLPTETFECHATGPFSASANSHFAPGGWTVNLTVEAL